MDDYELVRDIVGIVFPTIVGAYTSNVIINTWQIKKEKFKLSSQILKSYQDSFILYYKLITNFTDILVSKYIKEIKEDNTIPSKYRVFFSIPDEISEKPFQKFFSDYIQLQKELGQANIAVWNFYATVELYYDNPELFKKLEKLSTSYNKVYWAFEKFIRSENTTEFTSNYESLGAQAKEVKDDMHLLRQTMIESKIRKPMI